MIKSFIISVYCIIISVIIYCFRFTQNNMEFRGKKAAIAAALQRDINDEDTNIEENELHHDLGDHGLLLPPYPKSKLKRWSFVPPVKPDGDSPGEMGKLFVINLCKHLF